MNKVIAIVGRTGTGKSTLTQHLVELMDLELVLQTTTRPQRINEVNGKDYNFVHPSKFDVAEMVVAEEFHADFGDVKYGITKKSVEKANKTKILVTSPKSALDLRFWLGRENCKIIYVNAPSVVLHERLIERGDDPIEANRRINADTIDCLEFEFMADKYIHNIVLEQDLIEAINYIESL